MVNPKVPDGRAYIALQCYTAIIGRSLRAVEGGPAGEDGRQVVAEVAFDYADTFIKEWEKRGQTVLE